MRIAIASGKGGTGKTTLATNLGALLAEAGERAAYLDCDVEEPNGHLFLQPRIERQLRVERPTPKVDPARCTHQRTCERACRFSAIVSLADQVLTFPDLCHACGGCRMACPEGAITEVGHLVGRVELGTAGRLSFAQGILEVGQPSSVPVIKAVLESGPTDGLQLVDAPPGAACAMIEAVRSADAVVLVTEPTPFGLADLKQAVSVVRDLGLPFGLVINRADVGDRKVWTWCDRERIPILLDLPDDRRIAQAYARGELALDAVAGLRDRLGGLATQLRALVRGAAPAPAPKQAAPVPGGSRARPSERVQPGGGSPPKEIAIVSGKGGTGKTSICAALASLAAPCVVADCDVDAADLRLVLEPVQAGAWAHTGGLLAQVEADRCTGCGECQALCRFDAIDMATGLARIDPLACEGCGVCADHCAFQAINLQEVSCGTWFEASSRNGHLVHARLAATRENSGKLVTTVRTEARALAIERGLDRVLIDGSPGIGCPVIASLTSCDLALVVAEPSPSGVHDAERLLELILRLEVPAAMCINKFDLAPEQAGRLEALATSKGLGVIGRVRYDPAITRAQVAGRTVVDEPGAPAAADLRALACEVDRACGR